MLEEEGMQQFILLGKVMKTASGWVIYSLHDIWSTVKLVLSMITNTGNIVVDDSLHEIQREERTAFHESNAFLLYT